MRDDLLDNNRVIRGSPFWEKAILSKTNDPIKVRFKSIGNNLCDDLILGITKIYGSEIPKIKGISTFGNKAQVLLTTLSMS